MGTRLHRTAAVKQQIASAAADCTHCHVCYHLNGHVVAARSRTSEEGTGFGMFATGSDSQFQAEAEATEMLLKPVSSSII
jgi:hypothetical protein